VRPARSTTSDSGPWKAPQWGFEEGLAETVAWYRERRDWWEPIKSGEFAATTISSTQAG
jgi:dTDP-D-glucose 4,6-dehydratase